MLRTYILKAEQCVPVDYLEWAEWFEKADRHIDFTKVTDPQGFSVEVSTVFLGLNHNFMNPKGPPLLFETMVFGGEDSGRDCWRYSTFDEAQRGHQAIVESVKSGDPPVFLEFH
jgi:hypothetical protein